MKQTRRASLLESLLNTAVGFGISLATQEVIFWALSIHTHFATDVGITCIFTVVSIIRSFSLRRLFEHLRVTGLLS